MLNSQKFQTDDRNAILRFIHQKNGDRRANPRAPLATQVQCDQCMSLAFSRDISLGGMFVETTEMLPVGTALTVRFNLDEKDQVVTATAQVIYHVEKMGMGIVFVGSRPARVRSDPAISRKRARQDQLARQVQHSA